MPKSTAPRATSADFCASLIPIDSRIISSDASVKGGGISVNDGISSAFITNTVISANSAGYGGGISVNGGKVMDSHSHQQRCPLQHGGMEWRRPLEQPTTPVLRLPFVMVAETARAGEVANLANDSEQQAHLRLHLPVVTR